ncbi:helix-turn-helix domain-containing protein [Flavobacterium sp. ZB4P13]|uniref:helix-turn-helix domain-containing protein n=1 Tax=Flavobacterium sp. ZB4P13 TaxID=3401728 RepID=UPI003AAF08DC
MNFNYNPFEVIVNRLNNIESLLLDIKHKPEEAENKLYSVKSLASLSGVSELTVRNWIREGKIQAKRIGRRLFIEQTQFAKGLEEVKSLKYKR